MTISTNYVDKIRDRLPSQGECDAANQLCQILTGHAKSNSNHCLKIIGPDDKPSEVQLTSALLRLLIDVLGHVGGGDAVRLSPVSQVLSTQRAADVLDVPVPYLLDLLKTGAINHHRVGRNRRIRAEDIFAFKNTRDAERALALKKLAKIDQDFI